MIMINSTRNWILRLRILNPRTEDPRTEDPRTEDPRTKDPRIKDPVHGVEFCRNILTRFRFLR